MRCRWHGDDLVGLLAPGDGFDAPEAYEVFLGTDADTRRGTRLSTPGHQMRVETMKKKEAA
jgi:hypothetical protein